MMIIAWMLGGALMGGVLTGEVFGWLFGAMMGLLWSKFSEQQQRITDLQRAVEQLKAAAHPPEPSPRIAAPPTINGPVVTPAVSPPSPPTSPPPIVVVRPIPVVVDTPQPSTARTPPASPPPPPPGGALLHWLGEGNLIVKAGIAILFLGLAFLAKYASEHVEVPMELRLAGIASVALGLLAVGWRLRVRRAAYAQALQGGAVAVLYLTLFAAFRFYGVLDVGPAFSMMVLVAALAAALAVLQQAQALAVIGALGGFATPLLMASGHDNPAGLFGYYLVLDAGIAAVAWHTTWRRLNLIGFFATFIVATTWGVLRYDDAHYAVGQGFLIAYFLLFNAILWMPARQNHPSNLISASNPLTNDLWLNGTLLFGLPTITFVLHMGMLHDTPFGVALSCLVMAGFYVALAAAARKRGAPLRMLREASLAIATLFLTLAIPFAINTTQTAGAWALEAAGLIWLGRRQNRLRARQFGYVLMLLSGLSLSNAQGLHLATEAAQQALLLHELLLGAAALIAAYSMRGLTSQAQAQASVGASSDVSIDESIAAEPLLIGWASLWLLIGVAQFLQLFVPVSHALAGWMAGLSVLTLIYLFVAVRLRWPMLGLPVMAHAPSLMVGVLVCASDGTNPVLNGGGWAWPVALLTHALVLRHAAPHWSADWAHLGHTLGALVLAGLGTLLGRSLSADLGDASSAWPWLGGLVTPALMLIGLLRPSSIQHWPLRDQPLAYQHSASGLLSVGLLIWVIAVNMVSNGSAAPLPYVPLINPLDIGVATALLAVLFWLRSPPVQPLLKQLDLTPKGQHGLIAGVGFFWLNAMLVRAFYHHGGVPFRLGEWLASVPLQTGLSLLWSITALAVMWWSSRRGGRSAWMAGATLLAAVILKLLLIDLAATGTVLRIVSFIGVGLLMLVMGYVAPMPKDPGMDTDPEKQKARHA